MSDWSRSTARRAAASAALLVLLLCVVLPGVSLAVSAGDVPVEPPIGLRDFLLAVITTLCGAAAFWLMEHVKFLKGLPAEWKRYSSLALGALIAVAAWLAGVAMQYWSCPGSWRAWVESVFAVAAVGVVVSQGLHGALVLRKRASQP